MIIHVVAKMFNFFRDKWSFWRLVDTTYDLDLGIAPRPRQRMQTIKRLSVQNQDRARPQLKGSLSLFDKAADDI